MRNRRLYKSVKRCLFSVANPAKGARADLALLGTAPVGVGVVVVFVVAVMVVVVMMVVVVVNGVGGSRGPW